MRVRSLGAVLALLALAAPGGTRADAPAEPLQILVLSNRADVISGGDALVEIVGADPTDLQADVDGRDVSGAFAVRPDGRVQALVSGLAIGANTVTARSGVDTARITITNHSINGPVLSGPQIQPWSCAAGTSQDGCARPASYSYVYMSKSSGAFAPYGPDGPEPPPANDRAGVCRAVPDVFWDTFPYSDSGYVTGACARTTPVPVPSNPIQPPPPTHEDVDTTTTEDGRTVPYIVRLEEGSINRGRYQIGVLFDPSQPWDRWAPQPTWNHKLVISHGHGCGATYGQGEQFSVLEQQRALSKGYAVLLNDLNNSGSNCNVVTQAESMIMTKEHFIESYGDVLFTIGTGGSGGALAQQWVANAYPGLYDGLLLSQSFPDAWSTALEIEDCALLVSYWQDPTRWGFGVAWSEAQKQGVEGHLSTSICQTYVTVSSFNALFQPGEGRDCGVPAAEVYEPSMRPDGVRCSLQDYAVNVVGRRAADGFAGRPYDNTGVQYGLAALRAGTITPLQFIDLNAKIGSHDIDYVWQPSRVRADRASLEAAYRSGLINQTNNMDQVAIIERRGTNTIEIHHHVRTWQTRARLDRAHGQHDNHVVWWGANPTAGDTTFSSAAFDLMSQWLTAVKGDASDDPVATKIKRNKPAAAKDRCTDGRGGDAPPESCRVPDATPRIAAGGPLTDDVVECRKKPLDRADDYGLVPFTDSQWQQLEALFPGGVCDYSQAGEGQQPTVPWLTYRLGPGGVPLGEPPASTVRSSILGS